MKHRIGFAAAIPIIAAAAWLAHAPAVAADLNVREIGSFYIGGEEVRVGGQPIREVSSAQWRDAVKDAGGSFDWIELPALGIAGNTHMMMDKNSDQVAGVVQDWLSKHGAMR